MANHVGFLDPDPEPAPCAPSDRTPAWLHAKRKKMMKTRTVIVAVLALPLLQGCTVLAIADVAASTVIYGVKTVVNVVDAVTPDIINKDKKKD
jgi:hypothetical protein